MCFLVCGTAVGKGERCCQKDCKRSVRGRGGFVAFFFFTSEVKGLLKVVVKQLLRILSMALSCLVSSYLYPI